MKAAVIGPLCRDTNIVSGEASTRCGGVTYYAGLALARLGVETLVLGSFASPDPQWPDEPGASLVRLNAAGTLEFINEYPEGGDGTRIQHAKAPDNRLRAEDILDRLPGGLDFIILGPLFHDNLSPDVTALLADKAPLALAAQGLIRHLEHGRVVWENPHSVLMHAPYCDYISLDEAELAFITGRRYPVEGSRVLMDAGAGGVLVTNGAGGSTLVLPEGVFRIKAFPPESTVDPTGAGDTYLAAFLRAAGLFDSPVRRGEFAAMAATVCIENSGAFGGSLERVLERLRSAG